MISRPHCKNPGACSAKGKGHCRSCHMTAAVKANWQDPAFRERNAAAVKTSHAARRIQIPAWVPTCLHEEYAEVSRQKGEEATASHCRRLKSAMREAAE